MTATEIISIKRDKEAPGLILDIDNLEIKGIWIGKSSEGPWGKATYEVKPFTSYGSALHVALPAFQGNGNDVAYEMLYVKVCMCLCT